MKREIVDTSILLGDRLLRSSTETDEEYLEEIYGEYADSLFRYALALTGSADDAEDAVQDLFIALAREVSRVRSLRNTRSYLFSAIRNAAFSILRSRRRRNELIDADEAESLAVCTEEYGGEIESSVAMQEALLRLPVEQREVVVLKVFDGMTFREIAETTGASINTVASRYRYGIESLRRALEDENDGR